MISNISSKYGELVKSITRISRSNHLTPEISLRLMSPEMKIWRKPESEVPKGLTNPPFWAIYWPGGQALARYILDNPEETVSGRKVLDLGTGSGACAIAAAISGAKSVLANDIDPVALASVLHNLEINERVKDAVEVSDANFLTSVVPEFNFDVVLIGDMFFDEEVGVQVKDFVNRISSSCRIFIGDPGRWVLRDSGSKMARDLRLSCLAKYELPQSAKDENYGLTHGFVYAVS